MHRILLVDNEPDWLTLMSRALPGYYIDKASSYDDALRLLQGGPSYDVAVVDLNLVDSGDGLGREVLAWLHKERPQTRRIALTAFPPGAVRRDIFIIYDVDELLLKPFMPLSLLREVVQAALARGTDDIEPGLRASRSELWQDLRSWQDDIERPIVQRLRTLEKDRRIINQVQDLGMGMADPLPALDAEIAELVTRKTALVAACSGIESLLRDMVTPGQASTISDKIANLKKEFGFPASR